MCSAPGRQYDGQGRSWRRRDDFQTAGAVQQRPRMPVEFYIVGEWLWLKRFYHGGLAESSSHRQEPLDLQLVNTGAKIHCPRFSAS